MRVGELPTPAVVVDGPAFERNLATMARARPGAALRPHVKAHKSSAVARLQQRAGHDTFCAATPREVVGLADAGLGTDLLLANQCLDADRLSAMAGCGIPVTVAVDSDATIVAAAAAGIGSVLIDVNVGLPRGGCAPADAARLAETARRAGLEVRGVMGYEGHVVGDPDDTARAAACATSMAILSRAHDAVGGPVVSAGGTGTYLVNQVATEIQAGSYVFSDTAYRQVVPEFELALHLAATVVTVTPEHVVADCGLKALGMDHGPPSIDGADVWFCSDEHVTFAPTDGGRTCRPGDRVLVQPAHIDPTIAYHDVLHVADGGDLDATVVDAWPVDLRGW